MVLWGHFCIVADIEPKDGNIYVHISRFDKAGYYYNYFSGIFMVIAGLLSLAKIPMMEMPTILGIIIIVSLSLFLMLFGLLMLSQTSPVRSAKKINKLLDDEEALAKKSSKENCSS
ncbi:MAG: hypothetical protein COA63_000630 [Methylophaga sp.]|nr:hypothetical protein [Methylophaga sp.]